MALGLNPSPSHARRRWLSFPSRMRSTSGRTGRGGMDRKLYRMIRYVKRQNHAAVVTPNLWTNAALFGTVRVL